MSKTEDLLGQRGFLQIPSTIYKDCECIDCRGNFPKHGKLWTDQSLRVPADNCKGYRDWRDKVRTNTYCTFHAMCRAGLD